MGLGEEGGDGVLMPVRTRMCPECCLRMAGMAALIWFTGPKLVSNCSRMRFWVRWEADSSSTVPMRATFPRQRCPFPVCLGF